MKEGDVLEIRERIKELRKNILQLSQDDFGKKINISRSNEANIETGRINVTDRVVTDICNNFSISERWLRTGEGDMKRKDENQSVIEMFKNAYADFSEGDKMVIKCLLEASQEERKYINIFLNRLVAAKLLVDSDMAATTESAIIQSSSNIEKQLADFRLELEAEEKGLSVLQNTGNLKQA